MHGSLVGTVLAVKDGLAVLVKVKVGDNDLGRVDTDRDRGTIGLLAVDALNVDNPLAAIDLDDLALATLVGATNDQNFVILADRDGANLEETVRKRGEKSCVRTRLARSWLKGLRRDGRVEMEQMLVS